MSGGHEGELRAAMERCGRFKPEVEASGQWRDPSDVTGQLAFRAEVPLRPTFLAPQGFEHLIEGEAPATGVAVPLEDAPCWRFQGHLNGQAMLARITPYEFGTDEAHQPLNLELRATAPEILADIECDGYRTQPPMSPMVWAVVHRADRKDEVFGLARFQPARHPVLFELEWQGEDSEDGLTASDTTRLRLVHIAQ
ncbi:MAG: hypothetical protein N2Z62_08515 [Rhodobacteraceae bacterium]|nr:hypothetical protein [Paracoccaceae bacterium]